MDLSILNKEQRQAVETIEGPLLVLAGAGSGKTRVLTYRIANLIEQGVKPWNILALTFTNKAAKEMHERTERLVGSDAADMWVTTFHSFCYRVLRMHADKLGRERTFTVYDDADQMSVIADILKKLGINDKDLPKREIKGKISDAKNKSTDPEQYLLDNPFLDETVLKVFRQYQKRLREANAMDFDDLLLLTLKLFTDSPDTLQRFRDKFRYVLVDEYQDTNPTQYSIVELICREHRNICVVGDDDQSIYGWRGADIRNILEFEKDFKGAAVIRLEQNYRSTDVILDAANAVIGNNLGRKSKRLWTQRKDGDRIEQYTASTERDEANYICKHILEGVRAGKPYGDYVVLYRMNAQSRVLESTLVNYGIPHKVYGGFGFYERMEIKDILAYLRLIYNPSDEAALRRIINVPKRGIGAATIAELEQAAEAQQTPMLLTAMVGEGISSKAMLKLKPFADSMTEFIAQSHVLPLSQFVSGMIASLDYEQYLRSEDKKGEYDSRLENLQELIGNIKEIENDIGPDENALQVFLENVALVSDTDSMQEQVDTVSLMTLHSAKGLEFSTVFLAGMEENIFPTSRARNDMSSNAMEEERRLCYVGITRAKDKLYLLNARQRALFGDYSYNRPSRFIQEIPQELIQCDTPPQQEQTQSQQYPPARPKYIRQEPTLYGGGFGVQKPIVSPPPAAKPADKHFSAYQRVSHAKFGSGTVTEVSGSGSAMMVTIDFDDVGVKRFAAAYAPITPVEE